MRDVDRRLAQTGRFRLKESETRRQSCQSEVVRKRQNKKKKRLDQRWVSDNLRGGCLASYHATQSSRAWKRSGPGPRRIFLGHGHSRSRAHYLATLHRMRGLESLSSSNVNAWDNAGIGPRMFTNIPYAKFLYHDDFPCGPSYSQPDRIEYTSRQELVC